MLNKLKVRTTLPPQTTTQETNQLPKFITYADSVRFWQNVSRGTFNHDLYRQIIQIKNSNL